MQAVIGPAQMDYESPIEDGADNSQKQKRKDSIERKGREKIDKKKKRSKGKNSGRGMGNAPGLIRHS